MSMLSPTSKSSGMASPSAELFKALVREPNGDGREALLQAVVHACVAEPISTLRTMFSCTLSSCDEMYLAKLFGDIAPDKIPL